VVPERKAPVVLEENPRNKEHREKIEQLEAKVKRFVPPLRPMNTMSNSHTSRLREEKKAWLALKNRQASELPPLFPDTPSEPGHSPAPALPDLKSLDANETQMLSFLTDPSTSFESTRRETQARLSNVQSALEFKIDQLADAVHKLLQRVDTAGREADKVLSLSSSRLKERENRERTAAGTREMPTMEVLRSLGRILPEGGG
jgi:kinetochore protein Mis13/DSN1